MLACPLCKTTNKNHFSSYIVDLNPNKLTNDTITARVQCLYCNDEFTVEANLDWKIKKTFNKEPNPKYTVISITWYKDENGVEFPLSPGSILTLQGFELSTHSDYSPFETASGSLIRLHNNRVKKIITE